MVIRVSDNILLSDNFSMVKLHFYIKYCMEGRLTLSDGDLSVLSYLYLNDEILDKDMMDSFYLLCIDHKIMGTIQSVRNSISRLHNLNLVRKDRKNHLIYNDLDVLKKFPKGTNYCFNYVIESKGSKVV